ncbi:MAG: hypothetical protein LBD13_03970 [Spirochaetaceae bacterium]|nr:hypothetical protein [Spirochaetaceae bacterium]
MKTAWALLFLALGPGLNAQSHVSIPLDNPVYYLLEHAQIRGILGTLPKAKPYSQQVIFTALEAILFTGAERLSPAEQAVLLEAYEAHKPKAQGLDLQRGAFYFSTTIPKTSIRFAGDIGAGLKLGFSAGYYTDTEDGVWGTDNVIHLYTDGDIGSALSYGFHLLGGITRAPRARLGTYNTYYEGFPAAGDEGYDGYAREGYINRIITVYSGPLAFFPYSYRKTWDGFVVSPLDISSEGLNNWPNELSLGPMIISELSGSFFGDALSLRFGRTRREWGSMAEGRSLVLNSAAQPFLAFEMTFKPAKWFHFSTLTGILEYFNENGLKESAWTSQNAYSIEQLELNFKDYIHVSLGTSAVWAKRFELGYLFPVNINFLYQDSIGDFDNMGFFLNVQGQYPGIGRLWASFFADEISPKTVIQRDFPNLDRNMYAFQFGAKALLPWIPFGSVMLSYTKIEPYCYTHTRIFVPWYNDEYDGEPMPMETAYINNGEGLGYYLPPNSDEILLRLEAVPTLNVSAHFQYQMVRHGASHGSRAVDGSSFLSELDPNGRSEKDVLKKFFLRDGAYQWQHIFRIGAEYRARFKIPVRFTAEFGVVYSYYTDIDRNIAPNSGEGRDFSQINTAEYPVSVGILGSLGIRFYL